MPKSELLGGVLISITWDWPQSLWHTASASPDLRSPSLQPQSVTVLWPVSSTVILLG